MRGAILCIMVLILASCGGGVPKPNDTKPSPPARIPEAIELLDVIDGKIYSSELDDPAGLAFDIQGNLYVVDAGNNRILKFDRDLKPVKQYGGYGSGAGRLNNPRDIIIDRGLNVYVLDEGNGRIVRLDVNLNYIEEIVPKNDENEIIPTNSRYTGFSISSLGEITVSDFDNSRLIRMDNFFEFSRYIGDFGYGRGALLNPMKITTDEKGNIFVADAGNGRIAVYDAFGNYKHDIGADVVQYPMATALTNSKMLWVADGETDSVHVFDAARNPVAAFGNPSGLDRAFKDIHAVLISQNDKCYLADGGNDRVLIYRILYEAADK
ncbi:MAG: NHL repeat-containing protein [Candidatus Zixiibacteriota bacterium]